MREIRLALFALFPALVWADVDERTGLGLDPNPPAAAVDLVPDPARRAQVLGGIPAGGVLLVPESTNRRVLALDPDNGNILDANFVPADATNLSTPINANLSPDGSLILVSDQINDVIQAFDVTTGTFVRTYAPSSGVNPTIMDNIRGWEYRPNQNLLVTVGAGANNNAIAQFLPNGDPTANFIAPGSGGVASPFDVYRIPNNAGPLLAGQFLVSNSSNGQVNRFAADGSVIGSFATAGTFAQQILQARNGNILVAAFSPPASEGVYEFSPTGTQINRLDNATTSGYRGVWELANGNILTTTGSGIFELDRSTGALVRTVISGISARYIEFVGGAPQGADLELTGSAPGLILLQNANVALQVRNLGPANASNARVNITLPAGVERISDTCATTGTATMRQWTIGTLANGATVNCTLTVRSNTVGQSILQAQVLADTTDPVPANNTLNLRLVVQLAAVPVDARWALALLLLALGASAVVVLLRR